MKTEVFDLFWLARLLIIALFGGYLVYDLLDLYREFKGLPRIVQKWILVHLSRQKLKTYAKEVFIAGVLLVSAATVFILQITILTGGR